MCPRTRGEESDADPVKRHVGVAELDVTPDYPVRLSGFGGRRDESAGVTQRIWAKAMVFRDRAGDSGTEEVNGAERLGPPFVLVTVDNLGIPDEMVRQVAGRLADAGVALERLAVTATHTHTAPMLTGVAPTLFGTPIPPDHQARIDRYTRELTDHLERVIRMALGAVRPARVAWGIGQVGFAKNRRTADGPVDHDLPVLAVYADRDEGGADPDPVAVYFTYACHCVTLSHNEISGDWAGYAQERVEAAFPGAIAMGSIGCGADQNPNSGVTGDRVEIAAAQGQEIADETERVEAAGLEPLTAALATRYERISLPFDSLPTRDEWEARAARQDAIGYHARVNLERLDRGEPLQTELDYPVQTWLFGDQLAMVFLPGEVVVDYALRLKREFDRNRLWIHAYANDAPCYIPSERILREGGYEGGGAMVYYDRPTRLAPGVEKAIVDSVHRQIPDSFRVRPGTEGIPPQSPERSRAAIRVPPGFEVRLAAAEPLIEDPVAIDFGGDGTLWVVEMRDYPTGMDGQFEPGGRVKRLWDSDRDGRFDRATVFAEHIPFPTGITEWGRGVLVCAAPDILYLDDTDGDGKADRSRKMFSGFATDNYQARVNSLRPGLDNWIYGANGLIGGSIRGAAGGEPVDIRGRDFRMRPEIGALEPVTGLTQQGRVRNDAGDWFGCTNGEWLRHYPLQDRYARRNPHVPPPPPAVSLASGHGMNRLYPASRPLDRFNDPDNLNRVTSACGLEIYRDRLLGDEFFGNAFVCEPVHNLVRRLVLAPNGATFTVTAPEAAETNEFLASSDNWFRPVEVRAGPDGTLWVVDMYRFVIEHPRWIAPGRLSGLDVRAGAGLGRIYRVQPVDREPRAVAPLDAARPMTLIDALNSPSGTRRDQAQLAIVAKHESAVIDPLRQITAGATNADANGRLHAMCALDGLGVLAPELLLPRMTDHAPIVRRHAARLSESFVNNSPNLGRALAALAADPDPQVRLQAACSLGEWDDPLAGNILGNMLVTEPDAPYIVGAILSSAPKHIDPMLSAVFRAADPVLRRRLLRPLIQTAAGTGDPNALAAVLERVHRYSHRRRDPDNSLREAFLMAATLLDSFDDRGTPPSSLRENAGDRLDTALSRLPAIFDRARVVVQDGSSPADLRAQAVTLLGREAIHADAELRVLANLLRPQTPADLQLAAVRKIARFGRTESWRLLLDAWAGGGPIVRRSILDEVLKNREGIQSLLDRTDTAAGWVPALDPAQRQRLLRHPDASIRERARTVIGTAAPAARADVIEQYRAAAALTGDPGRGAGTFSERCAVCHQLGGVGAAIGPDLAALTDRSAEALLIAILDPNRETLAQYVSYDVDLADGRTLSGMITDETAGSVTVQSASGESHEVLRSNITGMTSSGLSLMPEGLEIGLDPPAMADLIAFVAGKTAAGSFEGNRPAPVTASGTGALFLTGSLASIHGDDIRFEPHFGNIGFWHGPEDHVAWTVDVRRAGPYTVHLDWACADSSAGNAYRIIGPGFELTGTVPATGGWNRYRQAEIGSIELTPGIHRIIVRPGHAPRGALMDLRSVALAPDGQTPDWPDPGVAAGVGSGDLLPRDPATLARMILVNTIPEDGRTAAIQAHPDWAAALVRELVQDLEPDDLDAEYQRIPWLWRIGLSAGKRNHADYLRTLFEATVPGMNEPLREWQAVVLGGGVINGLSQRSIWPRERIAALLENSPELEARWERSLQEAAAMADNPSVKTGTRYDALRMLGVQPGDEAQDAIRKYLGSNVSAELQMGAISALSDRRDPAVAEILIGHFDRFTESNRALAATALLRDLQRSEALLAAIDEGRIPAEWIGDDQRKILLSMEDDGLRTRARAVFPD